MPRCATGPSIDGPEPYPIASALPARDGQQKVYVLAIRRGRLSISLNDNFFWVR